RWSPAQRMDRGQGARQLQRLADRAAGGEVTLAIQQHATAVILVDGKTSAVHGPTPAIQCPPCVHGKSAASARDMQSGICRDGYRIKPRVAPSVLRGAGPLLDLGLPQFLLRLAEGGRVQRADL